MRILVTGGFGYIGSVFLDRILRSFDSRVTVVDNLLYGQRPRTDPRIAHLAIDLAKDRVPLDVLADVDAVVHLAALVGDPICGVHPELSDRVNRQGSLALVDDAIKAGVGRFVFVSTCSNYGRSEDGDRLIDESAPLNPLSLYAKQKVEVERRLLAVGSSLPAVVLRFATAYGVSRSRMRFDLTVNEFTRDASINGKLLVYGERFWRPYCHVEDIAAAIETAVTAEEKSVAGRVFNVGSTAENYTKQMICELLMKRFPSLAVEYVSKDEDPRNYRVSFDRVRNELGFRPRMTVPEGIDEILSATSAGDFPEPFSDRYRNVLRPGL